MKNLPPQLDLYYSVTRSRIGLPRLKELLTENNISINGAFPGLPPVIVQAVISLDDEIFKLLLDSGADIEITHAKAEKFELPDLKDYALESSKEMGKKVALNFFAGIARNIPVLRDLFNGGFDNTSSNSYSETYDRRKLIEQFIVKEQKAWQNIAGEYFNDLTPFACAVFRKDGRNIDRLLANYNVNPNPILNGKKLSVILKEQKRNNLAERLEAEANRNS